jgi:ACS family hexuronate transporter-like MFS transporter
MTPTLTRGQSWMLVLAATFTMTISYVDRQALAVLAPTITRELHISETRYGLMMSMFSLAYLVGAPFAGRWIDRVGARRGLLAAVLVWTVASALHALAPGFGALVVFRVLLGFAESPSFPGASQVVHRALPPSERPRGVGVLFTGSSIGSMIAPPIAVGLMGAFGWRGALLVSALAGLVWVPLWMGVAWRSPGREVLDAAPEAAGEGGGEATEKWSAWRSPAVVRTLVLIVASSPAIGLVLTWSAKYLVRTWGVTQKGVAAFIWLPPLMFDVGSVTFGDVSARLARHPGNARGGTHPGLIVLSGALAAGGTAAMTTATSAWMAMGFAGVAMFGGGGTYAMITSDMLARIPARGVSTAGGWCASAQALAFTVANPLIGRGVEANSGYREVLLTLAAWVVPGTLAWLWWPRVPGVRERGAPQPLG